MTITPETFDKAQFKKEFYPADPFNGVSIEATQLSLNIFALCVKADLALKRADRPEEVIFSGSTIIFTRFVRLDREWIKSYLEQKAMIQTYIINTLRDGVRLGSDNKKDLLEFFGNLQLHDDEIEADTVLGFDSAWLKDVIFSPVKSPID